MLVRLRREYTQLVTSGAQLLLLYVGFEIGTPHGWLVCLGLMAAISLFAWLSALYRLRAIRDTPTSRIASAAQGYVELTGRGKSFSDTPLLSKNLLLPCLWYRYRIERKDSNNKWQTLDSGESEDSFVLDDGSGQCVVDPCGAEIITTHKDVWHKDGYRYTEWKLLGLDSLYAIGQFKTSGGSGEIISTNEELKNVLTEWKQDRQSLYARFDLNNDGMLDMQEWMLARQAAKREAGKRINEMRAQPDTHFLGRPQDQRLFLISNLSPEQLARRYGGWAWVHLLIFFSALSGIAWLLPLTLLTSNLGTIYA